jgi:DNA topoisomerase-2
VAFFYKFWPRLLTEKRIHITRSPIMISTNGKDVKWFFTYDDATEFKSDCKGYTHRYIKGLGSLTESEYDRVINDPVLDTVTIDDANYFQIMFGNDVSLRKEIMTK